MGASVQMNIRLDSDIKMAGDSIVRKYGYTPTSAVHCLWNYIVQHDKLPEFMPKKTVDEQDARSLQIDECEGMAIDMMSKASSISIEPDVLDSLSFDEVRESAWADRGKIDGF